MSDIGRRLLALAGIGNNQRVKHLYSQTAVDLLPRDLPLRKSSRVRERAESIALLAGIAAFWVFVFVLNFFVGQFSTPLIR